MNNEQTLALTRRQAAASINWPERTPVLVNPDPSVRRRLKRLGLLVGALGFLGAMASDQHGPLQEWARSTENRHMRPAMEAAMKDGNRAAGTWLATHFWKDYPGLLQKEADSGEPTAMFIVGRALFQEEHPERYLTIERSLTSQELQKMGLDLVRRAAAAGNQDALLFAIKHGGA